MIPQRPLPHCVVVIPAGGVGSRMQAALPKQFLELNGIPIIIRTIQAAAAVPAVRHIVVAMVPSFLSHLQELLQAYNLSHCTSIVEGGNDRLASVALALRHPCIEDSEVTLVHDAVRPFASPELFERVIEAAVLHGCAVPVVPVTDTIKLVDASGVVVETLDRSRLRAAQTPQGFRTELLVDAHNALRVDSHSITDDAMLCERNDCTVVSVAGESCNVKITHPDDLRWAETFVLTPSR